MVVTSQQREPGLGKKSVEKLLFAMAKPKVRVTRRRLDERHHIARSGPTSLQADCLVKNFGNVAPISKTEFAKS